MVPKTGQVVESPLQGISLPWHLKNFVITLIKKCRLVEKVALNF